MSPSKPGSDLKPSDVMSSPIHVPAHRQQSARHSASSSWSSSASSSYASTPSSSPAPAFSSSTLTKGKSPATEVVMPALTRRDQISPRRPSLLGSSLLKSEYTVINLAHRDGPPRLVTCVKSSQGFDWNQELFLPSYADYDAHDLEHKQDPVQDIILTDEEAAAVLPQ